MCPLGNLAKHGFTHGLSSVRLCDKNNEHFCTANVHCLVSHNLTLDSPCPRAMVCCFHLSSKLTETYVNPITKVAVLFRLMEYSQQVKPENSTLSKLLQHLSHSPRIA